MSKPIAWHKYRDKAELKAEVERNRTNQNHPAYIRNLFKSVNDIWMETETSNDNLMLPYQGREMALLAIYLTSLHTEANQQWFFTSRKHLQLQSLKDDIELLTTANNFFGQALSIEAASRNETLGAALHTLIDLPSLAQCIEKLNNKINTLHNSALEQHNESIAMWNNIKRGAIYAGIILIAAVSIIIAIKFLPVLFAVIASVILGGGAISVCAMLPAMLAFSDKKSLTMEQFKKVERPNELASIYTQKHSRLKYIDDIANNRQPEQRVFFRG